MAITRRKKRVSTMSTQSIEDASRFFLAAVKEGPDFVCTCCHRLMYRKTVIQFRLAKYTKLSDKLLHQLFPPILYTSAQQKIWVCRTCDSALKKGNMPNQAKANNLLLEPIPQQLKDLNEMEIRLISLRIPFMKMVALPCGKQKAIHGPAVNVPTDLHPVCDLLPRLPSQAQIVPMKIKRRLCYKGHYMYQYIQTAKILAALEWLKKNNPLYKDVRIDQNWVGNAALDDNDLWEAFSSQQHPSQEQLASPVQQHPSQEQVPSPVHHHRSKLHHLYSSSHRRSKLHHKFHRRSKLHHLYSSSHCRTKLHHKLLYSSTYSSNLTRLFSQAPLQKVSMTLFSCFFINWVRYFFRWKLFSASNCSY